MASVGCLSAADVTAVLAAAGKSGAHASYYRDWLTSQQQLKHFKVAELKAILRRLKQHAHGRNRWSADLRTSGASSSRGSEPRCGEASGASPPTRCSASLDNALKERQKKNHKKTIKTK